MKKVTVYSTTTCPYCVALKQWLEKNSIAFEEYLVDKNPYAAQVMIQTSGQMGVPFSTVENEDGTVEKVYGFDRAKLSTLFGV